VRVPRARSRRHRATEQRDEVAASPCEQLASYRLFQHETSLEVRQRFIVGPDDE
jgi:hypothetical protein